MVDIVLVRYEFMSQRSVAERANKSLLLLMIYLAPPFVLLFYYSFNHASAGSILLDCHLFTTARPPEVGFPPPCHQSVPALTTLLIFLPI